MPRYVILLHEITPGQSVAGGRVTHWDLMLEQDGILRTWALATCELATCELATWQDTAESTGEIITSAEQLPDHRLAYLDYEGPVSGNRGVVSRCEAGEYELLAESSRRIDLRLTSGTSVRYVSLSADTGKEGHFWIASFSFAPIRGTSSSGPSSATDPAPGSSSSSS